LLGLASCAVCCQLVGGDYAYTPGENAAHLIQQAQISAAPALTAAVNSANAAGVDVDATGANASAQIRAIADLNLLSEVAAFAGSSLAKVDSDWKAHMASSELDVSNLLTAFRLAEEAGVPEDELQTAWSLVRTEILQQVKTAKYAVQTSVTPVTADRLAHAILAGHQVGVDAAELEAAREEFSGVLAGCATGTDMALLEVAVEHAGMARVAVPSPLVEWAAAQGSLVQANRWSADDRQRLPDFLGALARATELGLPASAERTEVQTKATSCATSLLNEVLARKPSQPSTAYVTEFLEALGFAQKAKVDSSQWIAASTQIQALGIAYLQEKLANDPNDHGKLGKAFEVGVLARVPGIDAKRAEYNAGLHSRLASAKRAIVSSPTAAGMEELAHAIALTHKLAHNADLLESARQAYAQALVGPFLASDVPFVKLAVEFASVARAKVPDTIMNWPSAESAVESALALPVEEDARNSQTFQQALLLVAQVGLPDTLQVTALRSRVRSGSTASLDEVLAKEGSMTLLELMPELVVVVELAKAAGANTSTAQTAASSLLTQILAGDRNDASALVQAFDLASAVGVSQVAERRAALQSDLQKRLVGTRSAAAGSGSVAAIEALARSIQVAHKLGLPIAEVESARATYAEQMQGNFSASDMVFVESAADFASLARVPVPGTVSAWMVALDSLRGALNSQSEDAGSLNALIQAIAACDAAGVPATAELEGARATAKALATAGMAQATAESGSVLALAMDAAVMAGIKEADILSGQAVLRSQ